MYLLLYTQICLYIIMFSMKLLKIWLYSLTVCTILVGSFQSDHKEWVIKQEQAVQRSQLPWPFLPFNVQEKFKHIETSSSLLCNLGKLFARQQPDLLVLSVFQVIWNIQQFLFSKMPLLGKFYKKNFLGGIIYSVISQKLLFLMQT